MNQFIAQRSLDDCIPVGHSIAGMLLPAVARHQGSKLREVVYLAHTAAKAANSNQSRLCGELSKQASAPAARVLGTPRRMTL